jgi:hypothetical protein
MVLLPPLALGLGIFLEWKLLWDWTNSTILSSQKIWGLSVLIYSDLKKLMVSCSELETKFMWVVKGSRCL